MVRPLFVLIIVIEKKFYLELNNNYNKETYNVHQLKYNKMTNYVKAKVPVGNWRWCSDRLTYQVNNNCLH